MSTAIVFATMSLMLNDLYGIKSWSPSETTASNNPAATHNTAREKF